MNRLSLVALLALAALLSACGGQAGDPAADPSAERAGRQLAALSLRDAGPQLGDAPTVGDAVRAQPGRQARQLAQASGGAGLSVDTADREAVRLFFNKVYVQPDVPMGWTGSYQSGNAGTVSTAYLAATIQRLNWYRAMAGLPANATLSADNGAKDQEAALMMSANGQLSHTPPGTWKFYTANGAQAAGSSNLALGANGPAAIDGYIADPGDNNAPVGHRRWVLYPQTRVFGTGDVPPADDGKGGKLWGANALWVFDGNYGTPRPAVRDDVVAWPARGYMPYQVVYGRWSLSYPNADFSQATVAVSKDGAPAAVTLEKLDDDYGERTLVWQVAGIGRDDRHARPDADVRYHVSVSNVLVAGRTRSFDYDVVVFDPATPTAGAARPQLAAPATVPKGQPYAAQVAPMPDVTGYGLLVYRRASLGTLPATSYDDVTWTTSANSTVSGIGNNSVHLYYASGDGYGPKTVTLNKKLVVAGAGGGVTFSRALATALASQNFRLQVSTDDGASWQDAYAEAGRGVGTSGPTDVTVSLNAWAGRALRLRFEADDAGTRYLGADTGWTVRNIAFDGVAELLDEQDLRSATGAFTVPAAQSGNFVLIPRVQYQSLYFSDGGPPAWVTVEGLNLNGPRANYTLALANGVLTVSDKVGGDGVQTVQNPFRIDFTDATAAFDVDGNAGQTYRLYRAAFNRKPDSAGLGYWIHAMDGGMPLGVEAQGFAQSGEFASLYGAHPSNAQVITALYRNVLHRDPDTAGAAYWTNAMANGLSVADTLVQFSESTENRAQVAPEIQAGIVFTRQ